MTSIKTEEKSYQDYNKETEKQISGLYDSRKEAQLEQLKGSYEESRAEAQAAADKIPVTYREKANQLAASRERDRQSFNTQAAARGLNTGTASQAALAQNSAWQRDYGALRKAQAQDESEAQRGLAQLTARYQRDIDAAVAESDYQKAAALLNEYRDRYNRDLHKAQTLASFGDFSMYAELYGQAQADSMYKSWKAQNPLLAYNTGGISAQEYRSMTGSYPPGYTPPASTGGDGGDGEEGGNERSPFYYDAYMSAMVRGGAGTGFKELNNMLNSYVQRGLITTQEAQEIAAEAKKAHGGHLR